MSFELKNTPNATIFKVTAERLDSTIAPDAKAELNDIAAKGVKNIIVDISAVKYCDSSGLSVILVANRLCKLAGGKMVISGPNEFVHKLICISQLDSILKISPSLDEALKVFL